MTGIPMGNHPRSERTEPPVEDEPSTPNRPEAASGLKEGVLSSGFHPVAPLHGDRTYHVRYLLGFNEPYFIAYAFQVILGRDADPRSHNFFSDRLRRRLLTPVEVLGELRRSPEGRQRGVTIRGLRLRFFLARVLRRVPGIGGGTANALFSYGTQFPGGRTDPALTPLSLSQSLEPPRLTSPLDPAAVRSLGFPGLEAPVVSPPLFSSTPLRRREKHSSLTFRREGACLATLCTRSHLPFARALVRSFRRHHPEIPVVLAVVDLGKGIAEVPDGFDRAVTLVAARDIDIPRFDYMALKYSARDLCCALKPYLIAHVIERTAVDRVLFMDADIYVFAPLDALLTQLETANFVVTPHTLRPLPYLERFWEKPTLGDIFNAGVLNAGMFGLTVNGETRTFLDTWKELVSAPGAFWVSGQMEQHSFNWVMTFAPRVHVLRDTAYNVAYWNLHDRSVRYVGLDGEPGHSWTVDGRALVTFHFSGFSPRRPSSLSSHDHRYSVYLLPSIARLLEFYRRELATNGFAEEEYADYVFDHFPSGIPIDTTMRGVFKEYELQLFSELSPWTEQGESYYCRALLSPMPQSGSLIPILFKRVYDLRPDLRSSFPDADLAPHCLLPWISAHGIIENGWGMLFDRHRPSTPTRAGAQELLTTKEEFPKVFAGMHAPLGADRRDLICNLGQAGLHSLANACRHLEHERYHISHIATLRRFLLERPDLRQRFPDILESDAEAFHQWLRVEEVTEELLPEEITAVFERTARGKSLARIYTFVNDQWELARVWPLAFVGIDTDQLVRHLLTQLRVGRQFDIEDLEMFSWTMAERPWSGVSLTIELLPNLAGHPSTLYFEGQERLLAPVLSQDVRFEEALERYRHLCGRPMPVGRHLPASRASQKAPAAASPPENSDDLERTVFALIDRLARTNGHSGALGTWRGKKRNRASPRSVGPLERHRVNLFGYFKSPIGLGMMTRGLAQALELRDMSVAPNLMGNVAMDHDLLLDDCIGNFDFLASTNIFVSYPHHHDLLLNRLPSEMIGRQNVAYLAWEQRDGSPYWRAAFEGFDQIWALSEFAACCFRRTMERDVVVVPCALDLESFPDPAPKEAFGLDPHRFNFLYVFDANSSIERKNPEAAIRAFSLAFTSSDPVTLLLKVSNARRLEHRERLRRMVDSAARTGLDIRFLYEDMPRERVLRLLSAADAYVSLHRAEGFSYTCAEAMAYGKPVIATNYSGNLQFMNPSNSLLVDYKEVEVAVPEGPFQRGSVWAEPDEEHAAELMRQIYAHPEEARQLGDAARRFVREQLSHEAIVDVVYDALTACEAETAD